MKEKRGQRQSIGRRPRAVTPVLVRDVVNQDWGIHSGDGDKWMGSRNI